MRFLHFLLVLFCVIAPLAVLGNNAETVPSTPTPIPDPPVAAAPAAAAATVVDVSPIIQLLEKNQQQLTQSLLAVSTSVSSIKESTASSLSSELNKIISEQSASFSSVKESLKSLSSQYTAITEKLNEVAVAAAAAQSAAANPATPSGVSNEAVVAEIKQLAAELTKILTESNSYSTAIMTHVANANIDLKAKGEKLLSMAQLIEENRATLKLLLEKIEGSNNAQQAHQQSSALEKSIEAINKQLAAIQEKLSAQDALLNAVRTASNQSLLDNVYILLNNARNHAIVYYENALRFAKHSYDVHLPAFLAATEHSAKQIMEQAENFRPVIEDGLLQAKIELVKIHQQLIDIFVAKGVPAENAPLVAYSVLGLAIFVIALLALIIIQKILSLIFSLLCYVLCCGGCRKRKAVNNKKTSNVVNSVPLKPAAPKSVPAGPTSTPAPSNIPTPNASKKK